MTRPCRTGKSVYAALYSARFSISNCKANVNKNIKKGRRSALLEYLVLSPRRKISYAITMHGKARITARTRWEDDWKKSRKKKRTARSIKNVELIVSHLFVAARKRWQKRAPHAIDFSREWSATKVYNIKTRSCRLCAYTWKNVVFAVLAGICWSPASTAFYINCAISARNHNWRNKCMIQFCRVWVNNYTWI